MMMTILVDGTPIKKLGEKEYPVTLTESSKEIKNAILEGMQAFQWRNEETASMMTPESYFDKVNSKEVRVDITDTKKKEERLKNALLSFIEKTLNEPLHEKELEIVPALAHMLIELWKH